MLIVWDAISLTVLPIMAYPTIRLGQEANRRFFVIFMGVVGVALVMRARNAITSPPSYLLRPKGAKNCNTFNRGGDCEHRVGMPSGHVLMTTYVLFAVLWTSEKADDVAANAAVMVAAVLMAVARVQKGCHTVGQVVAGMGVGAVMAKLAVAWAI
jgi:membrane-associated phospholipid phosphatase